MRVFRTLIAGAVAIAACRDSLPPRGQVVLYLDTDAPVVSEASSPGIAPADEPVPLFDRVLVEIFPPGESTPCGGVSSDCVRELPLSREKLARRTFSFGWVPPPRVVGYRVRLRMFRSAARGEPRPTSTIELVGYLPAVSDEGITELTATFHADDVGRPRGTLDAPIVFDRGALVASAVGTWPDARVAPCTSTAPDGSVCVPGGAFFAGDPRVTTNSETGGAREHLVVLAPFFLDAHEVTVADIRKSRLVTLDSKARSHDPDDDAADDVAGACDYTSAPGPWEDRPVDCVSWQLARRFCQARGGDLPSEAELEYVASHRGVTLTPWSEDAPTCAEVIANGCEDKDTSGAVGHRLVPPPPGSGSLDRVDLPTGTIVDLGGSLSEWTRDAFARDDEACWRDALLRDPTCVIDGRETRSVKGGNLITIPTPYAQVRTSIAAPDEGYHYSEIGFRCAYRN